PASRRFVGSNRPTHSEIETCDGLACVALDPLVLVDSAAALTVDVIFGSTGRRARNSGVSRIANRPDAISMQTNNTKTRTPSLPTNLRPAPQIAANRCVMTRGSTVNCSAEIHRLPTVFVHSPARSKNDASDALPRIPRPRPAARANMDQVVSDSRFMPGDSRSRALTLAD